ncbi:hypothetical protein [Pseudotenacibaculum haliotis]|uniref:Uncharacterized protein n=1 Tax=Pseudotenacibaculum haliotis TaxID=1862138 RepID=A0ABW5LVA8_9FLAO
MSNSLFLLCPTDCLESNINRTFNHQNYFCTSLGNSFAFETEIIGHIRGLVKKHHIREIYFVLSEDNPIFLDALGGQFFSDIRGLEEFYGEIMRQKEHSEIVWQKGFHQFSVLSYYLNKKIKELDSLLNNTVNIHGKIYNKYQDTFYDIYSDLICIEKHCLN